MAIKRMQLEPVSINVLEEEKKVQLEAYQLFDHNQSLNASKSPVLLLKNALIEAGIQPLNHAQVERYKTRVWLFKNIFTPRRLLFLIAVAGFLGLSLGLEFGVKEPMFYLFFAIAPMIAGIVSGIANLSYHWRWTTTPLKSYSQEVPTFALARAIEVHKIGREHGYALAPQIEYLEYHFREHHPDPFLFFEIGRERWYLDVWDERKFDEYRARQA